MDLLPFSMETWALLVLFIGLLMLYGIWPYGVFKKLGIPGPKPVPFLGTTIAYRNGVTEFDRKCFKEFGKMWGLYDGRWPVLAITDPAMIKVVLVKECYSVFTNRRIFGPTGKLKTAVSVASDDQWKRIRTVLSPTFTSGKLKEMFPIIKHHVESLVQHMQDKADRAETVDIKDKFGAYSMDVVTSTSFGVNTDSMNNPNDPFVREARKLVKFDLFSPVFVLLYLFPFLSPLMDKMNMHIFPSSAVNYFASAVANIKQDREKASGKGRVDFLQLMIDSQKSDVQYESNGVSHSYKALSEEEMLAQAILFIFAGYEATSNILGFMVYELTTHPEIQQKLQAEIDTLLPNKAPITYDAIMQMEYLDMATNEVLRMYPVGGRIERICKKDVELNGIKIPKGMTVMIPPGVLHYDPEYWPEPEEFRPERFSKENKESINPYVYLPFGAGPRNCIGMRFALLTVKAAVASLMQNFTFKPCKETQIPLQLITTGLTKPKDPIILQVVSRASSTQ